MRRQRVVRASSAQNLCVFCACRFGLEPGIASIPRRNIAPAFTRPFTHSRPVGADNAAGSSSSFSANSTFTYDPNSSLTSSEQQEKWRRMTAQRKLTEERQRIEAEQQQAKQQAIWEADEKRRKAEATAVAAANAERSRAREEHTRRLNSRREDDERRKRSSGEQSSPSRPVAAPPTPSGQSLGQAMMSSKPRPDRNMRPRERTQNQSSNFAARGEADGSGTGLRIKKFSVVSRDDDGSSSRAANTSNQNISRQPRDNQQNAARRPRENQKKQPERVAMPDFLRPNQSSGSAAPTTTGWGAKATDVKPLEHGDVHSNVMDVDDMPSNVQDIRDMQDDDVGATSVDSQALSERPPGKHERRINFSNRRDEPAGQQVNENIREVETRPTTAQENKQSHAPTLDTFGYYEEDATFDSESRQEELSGMRGPDLTHVPSHKSHVVAEAAVRAAALGGFGQSVSEEQSQDTPADTGHAADLKSAANRVDKSADSSSTVDASPGSVAAPVDNNFEQRVESPANVAAPAPAASQPPPHAATSSASPTSSTAMSPEQREMMEKIEQMRRMVEDFDRMNTSKTASSPPTPLPSKVETSQPYGLGNSSKAPLTPSASNGPTKHQSSNNLSAPHRLSDTGYRATPFNPDELFQTSREPAEDDGKWGLLRRQRDSQTTPPPPAPQAPPPASQPRFEPSRQTSRIRDDDADRLFEEHRAKRTSYAPPMSSQNESYSFTRTLSGQDLSNKKCARCGQMGHTATMCQGPVRRAPVCHNCGKEGHVMRECQEPRVRAPAFKIFVGGVSQETTNYDFQQFFTGHDGVIGIRMLTHPPEQPGVPARSKGYGFVSFNSEQARERFLEKGPHTLLGKQLTVQHDQGSPRERGETQNTAADGRFQFDNSRVANPFDQADAAGSNNIVRRTSSESGFAPQGSFESRSNEVTPRFSGFAEEDSSEKSRGFKQPDPSLPVDESKRNAREARRRQWEEPEEEVEKSDKGADRKGRRGNRREIEEDEEDERGGAREAHRARKAARQRQKDAEKDADKQAAKRKREMKKQEAGTPITLPEFISVQHLSQALGVRYEAFVERLEDLGYDDVFAGKTLDSETSGMIAMEYNFDPTFDGGYREEEVRDLKARPPLLDKESLPTRPPVVTIMGHVDHGKTTLLDYLRKSSVAAGEAGGITQHIGAFSVPLAASGRSVTFLDTPGHAAFLAMRQRGANVTDMVILVVAADDSVKPQTLEAIKHAKEAGVPMIVALNKVDKPEADVERCKQDLARHGVEIEDYGGDVQVVEVSGKTGKGMDALEENIVALSELLDHRAETDGAVEGWVLEATTRKAGRVATVLVRRGTLVPGAVIVAGKTWARVRTLKNEAGIEIEQGGPGMPCEVDGWRDQPSAGDEVLEAPTEQKAGSVVDYRIELAEREQTKKDMEIINTNRKLEQEKREKEKAAEQAAKRAAAASATVGPDGNPLPAPAAETAAPPAVEPEDEQESGPLTVPFIIKADVSGSAEAVAAYILSLSSPLIAPTILASGVGSVHESDIELASAAEGHIIAFNLPSDPESMGKATARGVKILANDIIYRCLDDVKAVLEDKLPPIISSRVTGEAEISAVFEIGVGGRKKISIAGVKVRNGSVTRNARARVLRDGEKVYDGTINSLKNQKKDADVMRKGSECGMGFADWEGFQAGDQVQVYEEISEKRRL